MSTIHSSRLEAILPGDDSYEAARRLWNGTIDHRPVEILRPHDAGEVAQAVLYARERALPLAVRGGGHSASGQSMADGGITIDLAHLRSVRVDPATRRARVGGGALLDDVIVATEPHALAIPFGHVSHTGVGGITTGGGLGWLMRSAGLAVDKLRAAQVVTADGRVVRASEDEHPDLFWGLRGGGGNFGIVTEFEFELVPFGPEVLGGMVLHTLDGAADALRFCRDFMEEAPEELTLFETFMCVPPEAPFPAQLQGRPALALGLVWAGDPAEGERALAPLRAFGRPALDLVERMPPTAVQRMLDPTAPHGLRYYARSHWLDALPDAAVDAQVELHARVTSPMSMIINARMGGAIDRVGPGETAFGHRGAHRLLWVISVWDEGDAGPHADWCRDVFDALSPYSTGVYVNALEDEGADRVRAAYAEDVWRRLVEVKDRWDPDNVFRLNQNVPPSG